MYRIKSENGQFIVVTDDKLGHEFDVTMPTRSKAQAEQWCTALGRAAQVNEDRRAKAKGLRR
jgi:hypothetical protein